MAMTTSLKDMDPPMQCPPWPAGFPLSIGSPQVFSQRPALHRPGRQAKRREMPEQEPRYETRDPPYPSGFPLPASHDTPQRRPGIGLARTERKFLYEKQDPDINIAPSTTECLDTPSCPSESFAPLTPGRTAGREDHLNVIAEKEAREQLRRISPVAEKVVAPRVEVTDEIKEEAQTWWKKTQIRIGEAEKEGLLVADKVDEAGKKAALSDKAAFEADEAQKMAEEAIKAAREMPGKARAQVTKLREALADAKAEVLDRIRELQAAERDVETAEYDRETKLAEVKVVAKVSKSKRSELHEVERMLARVEQLRQEVTKAESRAAKVDGELKELNDTLNVREKALEDKAVELDRIRKRINELAQLYAKAISDLEASNGIVKRNTKIAETLQEEAKHREEEAMRLAMEYREAKEAAVAAAKRERELLESARDFSEKESETIIQGVAEKLPPPKIMQQDRRKEVDRGGQEAADGEGSSYYRPEVTPRPLQDIESD